jgi:hypothetical protein
VRMEWYQYIAMGCPRTSGLKYLGLESGFCMRRPYQHHLNGYELIPGTHQLFRSVWPGVLRRGTSLAFMHVVQLAIAAAVISRTSCE